MKLFSVENSQQVMRINHPDLVCLTSVRKFVPESFFQEDSILKGACDGDGYYKIVDIDNVNYLKSIPFIPHHNYLLKLNYSELSELLKNAIQHYDTSYKMFSRAVDKYQQLSSDEVEYLKGIKEVDKKLLEKFLSLNPRDFGEWVIMLDICLALRVEFEYYIDCIAEVHRQKYEEERIRRLSSPNQESPKDTHDGKRKKFSIMDWIDNLFK